VFTSWKDFKTKQQQQAISCLTSLWQCRPFCSLKTDQRRPSARR